MSKIKEIHLRWVGIPLLAFFLTFIVKGEEELKMGFLKGYLFTVFFTGILWNACFLVIKFFRNKYSKIALTGKRVLFTVLSVGAVLIILGNVISVVMGVCKIEDMLRPTYFFRHTHVNLISGFFISAIYEASYFFEKWKESVKLNEALKNQQIRVQFEVLQNQMSPHFLFNSLNTLTTLIAEDQKVAIDFTQTLSEVYRYILQNKERELVSLQEELDFAQSYVYLLKKRYPENLEVKFDVHIMYKEYHIAPLTLQMLIENAIKHNTVSKTEPLYIEVYVNNGQSIVVKNNLQPKVSLEKSTKTGLANIRKRYGYLGKRNIDIINAKEHFKVVVPLIKLLSEIEYSQADTG